jgi:two-component system chemotaxis response regulator CheY
MRTALIVDDSPAVRGRARSILEGFGFACREAVDGQQALDICRDFMPTLVLLDWEMPVLSGLGVATALRAEPSGGPKILFCSSHNDLAHIRQALEAGSDEYVMKPFDRDIIEDKLRNVGLLG